MGETSRPGDADASADSVDWFGLPSPAVLRVTGALGVAALATVLGAFILGEYQFRGWLPPVAGVLFGVVVAEIAVELGRRRNVVVAATCGGLTAAGLVWAGWISAGEGLEPIPGGAWLAAALGLVAAVVRVLGPRRG